jgi:glycosyltransferase involved in cell wall biosynthesis
VITCRDSGGPAELVEDEVTGLVVEPSIAGVAAAVGRLGDPEYARELGQRAHEVAQRHSWKHAVETLLGAI